MSEPYARSPGRAVVLRGQVFEGSLYPLFSNTVSASLQLRELVSLWSPLLIPELPLSDHEMNSRQPSQAIPLTSMAEEAENRR